MRYPSQLGSYTGSSSSKQTMGINRKLAWIWLLADGNGLRLLRIMHLFVTRSGATRPSSFQGIMYEYMMKKCKTARSVLGGAATHVSHRFRETTLVNRPWPLGPVFGTCPLPS